MAADPRVEIRREPLTASTTLVRLRLHDPDTRNSLSQPMLAQLAGAIEAARDAALLFEAAPPAFCSGLNFEFVALALFHASSARGPAEMLVDLYRRIIDHPRPTAALVQGPAVGGGFGLAACCDVVAMAPEAWFMLPAGMDTELGSLVLPILRRRMVQPEALFALRIDATAALRRGLADCAADDAEVRRRLRDLLDSPWPLSRSGLDEGEMRAAVERAALAETGRWFDEMRRRQRRRGPDGGGGTM